MLPYGKHSVNSDDIDAVVDVLRHGWLTQGPLIEKFEQGISEYVGSRYAVAVSNLTAGLHIGCMAAGLGEDDSVITSPISFAASANCALYVGARPAFADVDAADSLIRPDLIEKKMRELGNVKMLIPVHYGGLACDMEAIASIAKKHDCLVFEDAAQALGATYPGGKRVGSCENSLMTGFSFHPVKNIACGEGGVICTNDENIYRRLLRLRSHGMNKLDDELVFHDEAYTDGQPNPWYHEMQEIGFNFRITDIQCALGLSQLQRLDQFLQRRIAIAEKYDAAFADCKNLRVVQSGRRRESGNHLYVIRVLFEQLPFSKCELHNHMRERGIHFQVHYIPIPQHPYYRENFPCPESEYSEAMGHYRQALSLPFYPTLTDADVDHVIAVVRELVG